MRTSSDDDFHAAQQALADGGLIVYPTDTLYGLGCDATDPDAVERLRKLKSLPDDRGVSVLFATVDEARAWARWTDAADALADAFLPGPLTLVLDASEAAPVGVQAGQGTVAIRHVDRPATLALSRTRPIVSTSANHHGQPNVATAREAREVFGDAVDAYVDAGELTGPASTVVDARSRGPTVIREGALSEAKILEALSRG